MHKKLGNCSLAGTRNPLKSKKWFIVMTVFTASFLGMARNGRHLHESASPHKTASPYPRSFASRRQVRVREFWERTEESKCFHVDSVCNWKEGWFYGPNPENSAARQPTAMLLGTLAEDIDILDWSDHYFYGPDERIQFNISSDSHDMYDETACSFSPTPHHIVAHSAYNEMMGEFYVRTIRGLNRWMRDYPHASEDDVQVYVHFAEWYDILQGHRLFLGGLPNNKGLRISSHSCQGMTRVGAMENSSSVAIAWKM